MDNQILEEKETANTGLKWGGYAGAAYVLSTYVLYMVYKDGRCILWTNGFLPYIFVIIAMVFAAFEKRKLMGGYITFKVAVSNTFLVLVISLLCFAVFYFFLFNTIAPTLNVSVKHMQLDAIQKMLLLLHTPKENLEEAMFPYKADDYIMTVPRIALETVFSIMKGFFWAAITALIVRKNQPTV